MSAIISIAQRDAIHMITDGAAYDADTVSFRGNYAKAITIPHLNAVLSTRGPAIALPAIAVRLGALFRSFDQMRDGIAAALPQIVSDFGESFGVCGETTVQVVVVGWSESEDRGSAFMIVSESLGDARGAPDGFDLQTPAAFVRQDLDLVSMIPAPDAGILAAANLRPDDDLGPDDLDPTVDGLQLMEMQRASRVPFRGTRVHIVGGHALLSTVHRSGLITQKVLRTWPDEVGMPIIPDHVDWQPWGIRTRASANVDFSGLSRLQRERMQRKVAKGTFRPAS